ncbi:MAG TPA: hypothetical protein VLB76_29830 [Thermoanaerobaculia bacterium]|jgi:hypothetical protein|nr:hypothetical protein [Thermoanaerobaculia bacterium]
MASRRVQPASGSVSVEKERQEVGVVPNRLAMASFKARRKISRLSPGQQFEHTGNPLLRHYLDNRAVLIRWALKGQSLIAIVVAVLLTQVQEILLGKMGQYALATTLLGIPAISYFLNRKLVIFAQAGWKTRFYSLDYSGVWCYAGQFAVASKAAKLADPSRARASAALEDTFHGGFEQGEVVFDQDVFGLQVKDAFGKIRCPCKLEFIPRFLFR